MGEFANQKATAERSASEGAAPMERVLKDELARGDRALSGVAPVLTHLLASTGQSLVSDAVVARLRGMLSDIARQLQSASIDARTGPSDEFLDRFTDQLSGDSAVLSHCYALAMEGQLAERLEQRSQIDPVLTPLLQELIASPQPAVGELAMSGMAAQSRFIQSQRRMQLPLDELPAELFHAIVRKWEVHCEHSGHSSPKAALQVLRREFDEGASRIGLLARLVASMRGGAQAALDLEHAGLALFVSALSAITRQPRELAVLACHEGQVARLALTLRAAGLEEPQIERQFLVLEPAQPIPLAIGKITRQRAQALIVRSDPSTSD